MLMEESLHPVHEFGACEGAGMFAPVAASM